MKRTDCGWKRSKSVAVAAETEVSIPAPGQLWFKRIHSAWPSKAKIFAITSLLMILLSASIAYCGEPDAANHEPDTLIDDLVGSTPEDQFFLGMFTYHFNEKSRRIRNWQQNLIGLQYDGFFLGTFENSFYNRSWTAGISRELYSSFLANDWELTSGYRLGATYGYKDGEAPFASISPVIPIVELFAQSIFREHFGVELMLTTSISLGFFYQF